MLLPRTDAGVLVQVVALAVAGPWAIRRVRHRDLRMFVAGLWVLVLALVALRTVH